MIPGQVAESLLEDMNAALHTSLFPGLMSSLACLFTDEHQSNYKNKSTTTDVAESVWSSRPCGSRSSPGVSLQGGVNLRRFVPVWAH